jgi:hypothetical protein
VFFVVENWSGEMESQRVAEAGQFASVSELAVSEGLKCFSVARVLRLTLLAPDLMEAVVDGNQPITMHLQPSTQQLLVAWDDRAMPSFDPRRTFASR